MLKMETTENGREKKGDEEDEDNNDYSQLRFR